MTEKAVGNDGLTDAERAVYAIAYQQAVRPIDSAERAAIKAWRALSESDKVTRRRAVVVERVVNSMAMEGEPVSREWIDQATDARETK